MAQRNATRLARHLVPERYRLMLHPDFERFTPLQPGRPTLQGGEEERTRRARQKPRPLGRVVTGFTFRGEETIFFRLRKPSRRIVLHAKDLAIERAAIREGRATTPARGIAYDRNAETVTFTFPRAIPAGRGALELAFRGTLGETMRGFYRSHYETAAGERFIATTQFESTDARRAFPCVDEPSAKAVFDVTLMVPQGQVAISNTVPVRVREHESGYQIVRFSPTPKMSTYLLAFIVGDFEWIERKTREGVTVRVFVTPGKKRQAVFALEVACRALSFYSRYFGIPYPLPVLDMIAIPDFAAGAMENWGAVTYRESAILFDPDHSSAAHKQWVVLVIAHELAHQWFGNLVTMEWWTHLWLNEGFASYIEYLAVDHLFPKWDIWTQFVAQDLAPALRLDSLRSTHAIEINVRHPNEIGEIFDAVSYQKGSSIIRMLAAYLGERHFRNGLRHYLKKHRYANAKTDDLWQAFEHVSGKPVGTIMAGWTRKPGYPVVRILETARGIRLEQSRFFSSAPIRRQARRRALWNIPLCYAREHGHGVRRLLLVKKSLLLPMARKPNEWISFNAGASGFYRVDYPARMIRELHEAIIKKRLAPEDRFRIQSDAFALAESGELGTTEALTLAAAYRAEGSYTVWSDLTSNLSRVYSLIANGPLAGYYRSFARSVLKSVARRMGWTKRQREPHTTTLLRTLALSQFGAYGDAATTARARALFDGWARRGRAIPADLRSTVYGLAAENGTARDFAFLLRRYRRERLHEEKNRIGRSLGRFRQQRLLGRTLRFAISPDVRQQDTPAILASVWANPRGRELAWRFLRTHWKLFVERYGHGGHAFPEIIQPVGVFASQARAREARQFFKTHGAPGGERAVEQAIERIASNADWLRRDRTKIGRWLRAQAGA